MGASAYSLQIIEMFFIFFSFYVSPSPRFCCFLFLHKLLEIRDILLHYPRIID